MASGRSRFLRAIFDLQHSGDAAHQRAAQKAVEPRLALLRRWQSARLAHTYADLLNQPDYAPACRFFLSEIYAARDFSQRDRDFQRLHDLLARYLPPPMLHLLSESLALNRMTYALDAVLLRALVDRVGMVDSLDDQMVARAYLICDNYPARQEQIEQLASIAEEVAAGTHLPLVGITLRLARLPAERLGWFELYDFLERGYQAFQPMKNVDHFVQAILQRETSILDQIFAGQPDPFDLGSGLTLKS